jgi:hypothetical protein
LKQLIPQAQWVQVPGATHMVAGDQNDAFNSAVSGFVRDLAAAGNTPSPMNREHHNPHE